MLQSRAALCDVSKQEDHIDVVEQPFVMLQNKQDKAALCDVAEQAAQSSPL